MNVARKRLLVFLLSVALVSSFAFSQVFANSKGGALSVNANEILLDDLDIAPVEVEYYRFSTGPDEPLGAWVTMSCETPGVTIYYTTDGTDPTMLSNVYDPSQGLEVVGLPISICAIAVKASYTTLTSIY